ncbi:MAG TPA: HAD family hydrolase, partial [Gammaproteobacteria bacterium]
MPLQALVWDVDGTLVENEELHRAAFNAAFAAAGLPWHWDPERYRGLLQVAGGRERIAHFVAGEDPARARTRGFGAFLRELHADKTRRYGELLARGDLRPRPGVLRLIAAARAAGLRQAIATSTRRVNVDRLLGRLLGARLSAAFSVIASGDQVAAMKPAPDLYRVA